jgi:hypothetical protein
MNDPARDRRALAPDGETGGGTTTTTATATGGDTTTQTGGDTTTQTTQTAQTSTAKWWETDSFSPEEKQWLAARGLTEDDPMVAIPKMVKGHRAAEQRIGKGLDTIIDKPGKDEPWTDWVAKNRESLGLPKDETGYEVARPENWPKDAPWNEEGEAAAKAIALKYGLPKDALQELINIQAKNAMDTYTQAAELGETAKRQLMADLEKDYGDQTPAVIQRARRGAEAVAQKAGIDTAATANLSDVLTDKIGDASTIRFMAAIGDMMGDDTAMGIGKGGSLTTTPAEARAELATLRAPGGAYYEATAKNDRAAMERLKPKIESLTRIAAVSR